VDVMFSAAILLIILIVLGAAYLISKESGSDSPQNYGKIIAAASIGILTVVVIVGYMFMTYF
jgi:precorrin-6x reductase